MFDIKSSVTKGVMATTVALAMTLAGVGGLGATAEAGKRKSKSAKSSQKASSKASQKNSIKQGNKQANKNSTKQVAGNGGDGGDGGKTTCIAAANGNHANLAALGLHQKIWSPSASGNQVCGNEVENGDGHDKGNECKPYGDSPSSTSGGGYGGCEDPDDDGSDGGAGGENKNVTYQGNYAKNSADYSQSDNSATSVAANASETGND